MSGLPERRAPTHVLTISVPLNLETTSVAENRDIRGALAEAIGAVLPMIRVGTLGLLCDGVNVTMEEVPGA